MHSMHPGCMYFRDWTFTNSVHPLCPAKVVVVSPHHHHPEVAALQAQQEHQVTEAATTESVKLCRKFMLMNWRRLMHDDRGFVPDYIFTTHSNTPALTAQAV